MLSRSAPALRHAELLAVIGDVRRRWRVKTALRGLALWVAAAAVLLFAAAYALEFFKFTPVSIVAGRITLAVTLLGLAGWFIVRPQWRRVPDEQVALYLEEHEPALEASMLSAIQASQASVFGNSPDGVSSLSVRVIESALDRCQEIQGGRRIEGVPARRYALAAAGVLLTAALAVVVGPAFLRHSLSALFIISRPVEAAAPYRIDVLPGNATVPKGVDQTLSATLHGFDARQAALLVRRAPEGAFESVPMVNREDGRYEGLLFDLATSVEYYVEAGGVRSPAFTLTVVELPYTKRLDLELRFPSYTGLAPRTIEDGGDVAALRGTEVRVTVTPTMAAPSGRLVMGDGSSAPLHAGIDGTLVGTFTIDKDGFYKIELDAASGQKVDASPEHTIDMLLDQEPTVKISKPGRDTAATPVEEFFVEARADDDHAVRELQLVYAVNGGEEKVVSLLRGAKPLAEVTAGHTLYLEELSVQPGDSVSYYARTSDNDAVGGPKRATSDMFFLQVRPFGKEFKPATSMGGGGGGGGGADVGGLSQQQRQIIAGTFNVQRDRTSSSADKVREGLVVLTLSQSRLREQVEGLIERMNSRLVTPDPAFKKIADLLPQAAAEMRMAESKLQARSAEGALPHEQRALQFLQQAEEEFELQVSTSRNAGGGSGGGAGQMAEDLADLFKLELDRMANQYETAESASQQNVDKKVDELAEKLRELARRQEQELERQRREASGQSARAGGDAQRSLAEQAEEAARQLERLSRDENRADLRDAARQLRDAADAMRRAAASGDPGAAGQAAAAADRLRRAQKQLEGSQGDRAERDVTDALQKADALQEEQKAIAEGIKNLAGAGAERSQKAQALGQRKFDLESKVAQLEQHLDRAAGDLGKDQREASRGLQQAAEGIRNDKVKETIRYSRGLMGQGAQPEQLRPFEEELSADLGALRERLAKAAEALGQGKNTDRMSASLDKARELTRGVESLGQRMAERAREGQPGPQQSRSGNEEGERKDGRAGQSGQAGQQSRTGRSGESGQHAQASAAGSEKAGSSDARGAADGQEGAGDTEGPMGRGGWGDRRTGRFSADDIRQFRGEARRWSAQAQELRGMLREQKIDPGELDEILRRLRALEDERTYHDVQEIARLQTFVSEQLKRFEFGLRRKAGADTDRVLLSGSGEAPAAYRRMVEEYYRALSRQK